MLFNYLIYPHLKEKEQYFQKLEKQIFTLFDNYRLSWNNFCDQLGPTHSIPKLNLSIHSASIYDCLAEIEAAANQYHKKITTISEEADLSELLDLEPHKYANISMLNLKFANSIKNATILASDFLIAIATFKSIRANLLSLISTKVTLPPTVSSTFSSLIDESFSTTTSAAPFIMKNPKIVTPIAEAGTHTPSSITHVTIVQTAVIVLLVDLIFSLIDGFFMDNFCSTHIQQLEYVLSNLSSVMTKETLKIQNLTQTLKDGVAWLDDSHLIILPKEPFDIIAPKILSLEEFNNL
ncbi:MAG: hypothetical protein ACRCSG_03895 [Cellulosilyticaceae bacterium]